eukprot:CAMPEP_0204294110 /NCGR_PEP_ID=MMETSP0468-20130131/67392_1 /ASSEMBLY_ACC=CAM_ASM_000383 /TAXON_ID=2969 /ORGANISM="Oxyrrhis marina" /LENGTH=43 /DNA_ID= /DNA_START= /DNA_END= /DNA_ORIENTATION=
MRPHVTLHHDCAIEAWQARCGLNVLAVAFPGGQFDESEAQTPV